MINDPNITGSAPPLSKPYEIYAEAILQGGHGTDQVKDPLNCAKCGHLGDVIQSHFDSEELLCAACARRDSERYFLYRLFSKEGDDKLNHLIHDATADELADLGFDAINYAQHLLQRRGGGIQQWAEKIHSLAVKKGWYEEKRTPGDMLMLITGELSEAMEEVRLGHELHEVLVDHGLKPPKPYGFPIELVDALFRLLDYMQGLELPIEQLMRMKYEFNKTRPHKHGGKRL